VRIQSLNHDVITKQAGTRATIQMAVDRLDHDFVLLCALESPFQPRMWVEDDPFGPPPCFCLVCCCVVCLCVLWCVKCLNVLCVCVLCVCVFDFFR